MRRAQTVRRGAPRATATHPSLPKCWHCGAAPSLRRLPMPGKPAGRCVRCPRCGTRGPVMHTADAAACEWREVCDAMARPEVAPLRLRLDLLVVRAAKMRAALEVTEGNIRSLGPAGALAPFEPYREWLGVVREALGEGLDG